MSHRIDWFIFSASATPVEIPPVPDRYNLNGLQWVVDSVDNTVITDTGAIAARTPVCADLVRVLRSVP